MPLTKSIKILIVIGIAGIFIPVLFAQSQVQTLEFTIESSKMEYFVGEPVELQFNIKNTSPEEITVNFIPPFERGKIDILINKEGEVPSPYVSVLMSTGKQKLISPTPTVMASGETISFTQFISYNLISQELAFPEIGKYQIQAILLLNNGEIQSNIEDVFVIEPSGADFQSLSYLQENGLLLFLTPEVHKSPDSVDQTLLEKIEQFSQLFPGNSYLPFVDLALDSIVQNDLTMVDELEEPQVSLIEQIQSLIDDVDSLVPDQLNPRTARSLQWLLNAALSAEEGGDSTTAKSKLTSFESRINLFMNRGLITADIGEPLVNSAQAIIDGDPDRPIITG